MARRFFDQSQQLLPETRMGVQTLSHRVRFLVNDRVAERKVRSGSNHGFPPAQGLAFEFSQILDTLTALSGDAGQQLLHDPTSLSRENIRLSQVQAPEVSGTVAAVYKEIDGERKFRNQSVLFYDDPVLDPVDPAGSFHLSGDRGWT